ncbi:MAG: right-handed parallel beta-helix repeat-containing protein [Kiritimatiellae bacterium]|nr:right-handed parallel beta-helix repeat-containing protein [Kiritimatiellia bacterium]
MKKVGDWRKIGYVATLCVAASITGIAKADAVEGRPDLVRQVQEGKCKEARASWWGFNSEDSTEALQAALRSRASRLIIDKMPSPWISRPLWGRSDLEIVFEPGSEILAKKGEFFGKSDALFTLRCCTNVTIIGYGATMRMRRDDYDKPPYEHAEWRHALSLMSCRNIRVLGISLLESGGDGIYLGCIKASLPDTDIVIRDVICDKNYRQGISVISAENLLIENTRMTNTRGTAPQAGIDFEPNRAGERLKNCVMRNCLSAGNQGDGYEFYLGNLNETTEPVSIRLENCRAVSNNHTSVYFSTRDLSKENLVQGETVFDRCTFSDSKGMPVRISRKPAESIKLRFVDCTIEESRPIDRVSVVEVGSSTDTYGSPGGVRFERCAIRLVKETPLFHIRNSAGNPFTDISADFSVTTGGKTEKVSLDTNWFRAKFPECAWKRIPKIVPDLSKVTVHDAKPGELLPLTPVRLRHEGKYVFYVSAPGTVCFKARQRPVGRSGMKEKKFQVCNLAGKVIATLPISCDQAKQVSFEAKKPGFYKLVAPDLGSHSVCLEAANVPVAIDLTQSARGFVYSTGKLWFPIQSEPNATVSLAGEGDSENVHARIFAPDGTCVWDQDSISECKWETIKPTGKGSPELWALEMSKPSKGVLEDVTVDLRGTSAYLFPSSARWWK